MQHLDRSDALTLAILFCFACDPADEADHEREHLPDAENMAGHDYDDDEYLPHAENIAGHEEEVLAAAPDPASADAFITGDCKWQNKGEYNAIKACGGIWHYFSGSRVTNGLSTYSPPYTLHPSYVFVFTLSDVAADGHCTWIRVKKVESPWPFDVIWSGSKVCGKGESKNIKIEYDDVANMAPGILKIQHCWPSNCTTIARQRIPYSY